MERELAIQEFTNGTVLSEQFIIRSLIAHGGMGSVYEATNLKGDFDVALKILHSHFQRDREYRRRFEREINILRTISHPNVVRIFSYHEYEGLLYYVMERINGMSLDTLIEQGNFPKEQLSRVLLEICDGLSAIHNKNIVHRDIRPSNIIIMPNYSPKIIDFSIAWKSDKRLTQHNVRVGTLEYIPPEIWGGELPSQRSDQYCLGLTLYELLLGRFPIEGRDMESLIDFHEHSSIPSLRDLGVDVPVWVDHMAEKMVQKDPRQRFENMRALISYIKKHDEAARSVQSFSGSMAANTFRDGDNMITVFQSLNNVTDTIVRKQHEINAWLLSSQKEPPVKSGKLISEGKPRSKTVVVRIPGRSPMTFEVKMPSLDYLFLGGFLISLNIFDAYLTHEGVTRVGVAAERNMFLKGLMEEFGSRTVLVSAKIMVFCFIIYLTYLAHKSKHIQLIVGLLSFIYLSCAIVPWIYLLYWQ